MSDQSYRNGVDAELPGQAGWRALQVDAYRERVQGAYERALARVLADLRNSTGLRSAVAVDFNHPGGLQYRYNSPEKLHSRPLRGSADEEQAAVELATAVQDDARDDLGDLAWPACPGHPHPAEPRLTSRGAAWTCPASGTSLATIGRLTPAGG